jgi:SAM-dependent methyltransferase
MDLPGFPDGGAEGIRALSKSAPVYDRIGLAYARHRRPDPRIAAHIDSALGEARRVVDVGAGTGSYEPADRLVTAVEPSVVMAAQRPDGAAPVVRAVAERLPFPDGSFDAAMAVFTIHHWSDAIGGLREMARVAPRVVVLTFDPVVHSTFWLFAEYVPEVPTSSVAQVLSPEAVAEVVGADDIESVLVPSDCVDGFNWAFWQRPEAYLDPEVRACISGLAMLPPDLVAQRMEHLRADIADGSWSTRHGHLLQHDAIDGGLRLVIRR